MKKQNIFLSSIKSLVVHPIIYFILIFFNVDAFGQSDMFFSGNNRPFADAGRDINTVSKGSIFLDGSGSFVTDGSQIKYHWTFSPGLVLNSDNDFSAEISVEPYGEKYLKSIQTYKDVLDVRLAENVPGTKLEVILMIKDRIGFEDTDTLIVEYYDPTIPKDTLADSLVLTSDSLNIAFSDSDSVIVKKEGMALLIQSLGNDEIDIVEVEILNSIIKDQIEKIGYNSEIFLNKNLGQEDLDQEYNINCKTDSCASSNARIIGAGYVLAWTFGESEDKLSLRIFDSSQFTSWIATDEISGPYEIMSGSGVYALESKIRISVSKLMGSKTFKKEISTFDRFVIKNERWMALGKYPIMLSAVYLLVDQILNQEEDPDPPIPPGFPHDD